MAIIAHIEGSMASDPLYWRKLVITSVIPGVLIPSGSAVSSSYSLFSGQQCFEPFDLGQRGLFFLHSGRFFL